MRYAYADLGYQGEGTSAVVRWRGSAADVLLLDPVNFAKYRDGRGTVFSSGGGHFRRAPAQLPIPLSGRWYVVADLRGHGMLSHPTVEVHGGQGTAQRADGAQELVEVG